MEFNTLFQLESFQSRTIKCGRRDLNPGNGLGRPVY